MNTDIQHLDFVMFSEPLTETERIAIFLVVDKQPQENDRIDVMEIHQTNPIPAITRLSKKDLRLFYRPTESEKQRIQSGEPPMCVAPFNAEEQADGDMALEEATGKPANYGSTNEAIRQLQSRIAILQRRIAALPNRHPLRPVLEDDLFQANEDLTYYQTLERQQQ